MKIVDKVKEVARDEEVQQFAKDVLRAAAVGLLAGALVGVAQKAATSARGAISDRVQEFKDSRIDVSEEI